MTSDDAGEPRGSRRATSGLAGALVRQQAEAVAADWNASCDPRGRFDAVALVTAVADALDGCGGSDGTGHHHPAAALRFEAEAERLREVGLPEITCLREVLRRQVLAGLSPAEALTALHCIGAVLDELARTVVEWGTARFQRLAYADALTRLGNRRAAAETAQAMVANAVRHERPLVAVAVDVDHLKQVNDSEGHDAGDAVLVALADAFRTGLRGGDLAFRTGGDEFLVLLPETALIDADAVMQRVRRAGAPSFSYGCATAPEEARDVDALLRLADQRLLQWRRVARRTPAVADPRHASRRRGVLAGFLVLAVLGILAVRWTSDSVDLGSVVAVFTAGALAAAIGAIATGNRRVRSSTATLLVAPLIGLGVAAAVSPLLDSGPQPRRALPASQSTESTAVGALGQVDPPATTVPSTVPPVPATTQPSVPTPPATSPPPPTTTVTRQTATTQPATTTTTTNQPTTTAPTTTTQPTTTTRPTTTTTRPPARPVASGESVSTGRKQVDIDVLRNDRGGDGELDPDTLSIVDAPDSGDAEIRRDGVVRYRFDGNETIDRFQYQVCNTRGACTRAWVQVQRQRD